MRVIFLGPPGSGKGTQAAKLSDVLAVPQISTGDLLRTAIADNTALGKRAKEFVESGQLVPDALVLELVVERIGGQSAGDGFILDGFPRTVAQATGLEALLAERGLDIQKAIYIRVDNDAVVRRLSSRRVCPRCARSYNLVSMPPRDDERCDVCGVSLEQRADDAEETIRRRLEVYREETSPIILFYQDRHILCEIEGEGTVDDVFERIVKALSLS